MLTLIADENIANLDDYLADHDIRVIRTAGRLIDANLVRTHNADALWIRSVTPIYSDTMADTPSLKFIGSATIGTDHVDTDYLHQRGISFTNAAGCSKHSVAQYVITAILTARPDYIHQPIKIGIIGLGNIGATLASYAHHLGWQVVGYDPYLAPSAINNSSLDALLSQSDVVSIHTPLTKHGSPNISHPTFGMLNSDTLAKLAPHAILINSARGEIIDEAALLTHIEQTTQTVVLDVFPSEPVVSRELLDKLTLATPHIAGYTLEGKVRGTDMIYAKFCDVFRLPIHQTLNPLLPTNPYQFNALIAQLKSGDKDALAKFYDICADDSDLRAVADSAGVAGADFDNLRKNYQLRREWLFNATV